MEIMIFMNNNNNQNQKSKSGKKITTMSSEQSKRSSSNNNNNMPDLTDFMNDMFFGTDNRKKSYNLTGDGDHRDRDRDRDDQTGEDESSELTSPRRSVSGKMTQEWLDEARRMVASSSPTRCGDSPTRLVGSPRFAAATQGRSSSSSNLDRRDPLSRSARRYRAVESFSGEIISKTNKHSRNKSETFMLTDAPDSPTHSSSPTATVHHWFSNSLKPPNPTPPHSPPPQLPTTTALSRRQSFPRQSRFKSDDRPSSPRPQGIPAPPGRTVQGPSPFIGPKVLSPPRSLVESAQRRSISSSTCSTEKILLGPKKPNLEKNESSKPDSGINGFLRDQRAKIIDGDFKARIVLSGPSNRPSSMVAAICYAWLLENRKRKEKTKEEEEECVIVPVMNLKREAMRKLKDVSWLFHHLVLDVSSLLFADEVDLEDLMMEGKLSMVVIGQDVLRINGEVKSQCRMVTDNYCEEAYDLLQDTMLKKLLLAAILLDTENLSSSPQVSMTRDAEAVQLLLVGSSPNYRNTLFDQLTQDQRDEQFLEAMVQSYGKPPNENDNETDTHIDDKVSEQKSASSTSHRVISVQNSNTKSNDSKNTKPNKVSQKSDKPSSLVPQVRAVPQVKETTNNDPSRAKNKFSLAKWFGFGSK